MLLVVGGQARNVGKTSVACGILRHFRHLAWTAIKLTQDPKHEVARPGECHWFRETGQAPSTDSGRFFAAGARRAFWVRSAPGDLQTALPGLREILAKPDPVLIESNSVLEFLAPDIYLMVLDGMNPDIKPSSARFLERADLLVRTSPAPLPAALLRPQPCFEALPPAWGSEELYRALGSRLGAADSAPPHDRILLN